MHSMHAQPSSEPYCRCALNYPRRSYKNSQLVEVFDRSKEMGRMTEKCRYVLNMFRVKSHFVLFLMPFVLHSSGYFRIRQEGVRTVQKE